jgi:hypothetical protein
LAPSAFITVLASAAFTAASFVRFFAFIFDGSTPINISSYGCWMSSALS